MRQTKAMDRIAALGNSLIPEIPYIFAKAIKELENGKA